METRQKMNSKRCDVSVYLIIVSDIEGMWVLRVLGQGSKLNPLHYYAFTGVPPSDSNWGKGWV